MLHLRALKPQSCKLILKDDAIDDYIEFKLDEINPEYIVIGDIGNQWNYELMNKIFNLVMNPLYFN